MTTPLGICTRYDTSGASSRLRYLRYADALRERGFDVRIHPLLGNDYLEKLYSGRSAGFTATRAELGRLFRLRRLEPYLWIEYELLPFLPFALENRFLRGKKYVLGFDDAVYLKYRGRLFLDGKYERLAAGAAGVMAANDVLLKHFSEFNSNTIKIPTAVDTSALAPSGSKYARFTVVWIGTPVTFKAHLSPFLPALLGIRDELDFDLVVMGGAADATKERHPGVRFVPWSEAAEREILPRCHVGIMPLPDGDDFAAGKSAYKLIQYLAAGLPAVASPIGENRVVLKDGVTGFPAAAPAEWRDALRRLADDERLRRELSANARSEAEKYSTERCAPVIADFLEKSFSGA